ncbi:MAG TPA: nucleotidyltransferase domain-containing protein [Prolixibacteraceae bacterium]|nr:nucleotidyltransferase domain-containing protein [Prolixibacteraceae bacterium]
MDKGEAISKVKQYSSLLKEHLHFEKIYLFGSYAKNTYREDSDIDVAIVVNRIEGDYFSINPLLWKLRRQVDDRIEPILLEKDFDDANFIGEIQKHGIDIA